MSGDTSHVDILLCASCHCVKTVALHTPDVSCETWRFRIVSVFCVPGSTVDTHLASVFFVFGGISNKFLCEDGPRILKSIPREFCGNAKYHYPFCQRTDWMVFFLSWRILVSRVRCGCTRRGTGNELSSGSFVSGASSQFGFDLVGLASLSTDSLKSGEAPSFEFGHVVHYFCDRGHTVIGNAASTVSFTVPCLMSARGVFSVGFRKHFLFQPLW